MTSCSRQRPTRSRRRRKGRARDDVAENGAFLLRYRRSETLFTVAAAAGVAAKSKTEEE
jgi:hypothetical protein